MSTRGKYGPLVGAIDEGTSSARFLVFTAEKAEVLTYHQIDIDQICPKEGWVEQDPYQILQATIDCINQAVANLYQLDICPEDIVAVGITNQRETTILWDKVTGKPLYNALVWLDVRTKETVTELLEKTQNKDENCLRKKCGLPMSTYFSAVKIKWLIDNVSSVKEAINKGACLFGTVDSWLLWNLTGGKNGGIHMTDVTNASRTMLMNIKTLQWDQSLCSFFGVPISILPKIRSCSEIYGYLSETYLSGVPISGCLGDQQAALVGQMCLKAGQGKNTYGTGCFLLYNTGTKAVMSRAGLLTTVAYKLGKDATCIYALEGSIAVAGAAIRWMRNNLSLLDSVASSKEIAESAEPGHVVFVPAFSGLYAPYWRKDARSVICGLTEMTTKAELVRAALEAVCFQTRDILEAMKQDCGVPISKLLVDGGMTNNDFVVQQQADLCGVPVVRPVMTETTALGAAMAAGSAQGVEVWNLSKMHPPPSDIFLPSITPDERDIRYTWWKMAIQRSLGWDTEEFRKTSNLQNEEDIHQTYLKKSLAGVIFLFSSVTLFILHKKYVS